MWCSGNKKECRLFLKLIARLFIDNSDKSSLNRKTKEKLCLRSSFRHLFCFQKWMANDDDQRVTNNNNNNEMINWRKKRWAKGEEPFVLKVRPALVVASVHRDRSFPSWFLFFLIFCLAKPDPAPLRVSTHTHTESVERQVRHTRKLKRWW